MKKVLKILIIILIVLVILLILNAIRNYKILKEVFETEKKFLINNQNFYFELKENLENGEQGYISSKSYYKDGILNKISIWNNENSNEITYNIYWQSESEKIFYEVEISSKDENTKKEYTKSKYNEKILEDLKLRLSTLKISALGNLNLYMKANLFNFIISEDNCYKIAYTNGKNYYVNKDTGLIEKSIYKNSEGTKYISEYKYSENTVTDKDVERINLEEFSIIDK
jgi:hypothetical protein